MAGRRTLAVVHAHPDDETITTGGILARYSGEGVRTVVVTCTQGELGERNDAEIGSATVGDARGCELAAAARVLGVSRLAGLGYLDSGMPGWPDNTRPGAFFAADLQEPAQRLLRILEEERPDVLVTYDETGGYSHPDHVKTHQVVVAAYEAAGVARPRKLYFARYPLTWSRDFVRSLRAAGIDAPGSAPTGADAGPDVREVGVADELVTTAIDVRAYIATKRAALACHRTQMPPSHFLMRMAPDLAERLWAKEFFSREAGPTDVPAGALETDLFAGLDEC